ncbi:hypothetical protein HAX54_027374, partial [Datura stramonium]|nr:hypothetical protein [Datura stramonium]
VKEGEEDVWRVNRGSWELRGGENGVMVLKIGVSGNGDEGVNMGVEHGSGPPNGL